MNGSREELIRCERIILIKHRERSTRSWCQNFWRLDPFLAVGFTLLWKTPIFEGEKVFFQKYYARDAKKIKNLWFGLWWVVVPTILSIGTILEFLTNHIILKEHLFLIEFCFHFVEIDCCVVVFFVFLKCHCWILRGKNAVQALMQRGILGFPSKNAARIQQIPKSKNVVQALGRRILWFSSRGISFHEEIFLEIDSCVVVFFVFFKMT